MESINHAETINTVNVDSSKVENMSLNELNYYSIEHPESGTFVLAKFNKQADAFFGTLTEFPGYRCIMNYIDVVKKRKVASWAKFVPMDKVLVVQVHDVDTNKKMVQTSMAYLSDNFKEVLSVTQIQDKLMEPFNENKTFEGFIKSLCIVNNLDFKDIWVSLVYHIDELRREIDEDDECDEIPSLWKYFTKNFNNLDDWIVTCGLDESIGDAIKELYEKRTKESPKKITSKIGIISIGGINATKELISKAVSQLKYTYSFRYDTTPYYMFETSTEDSDISSHNKFVKVLETESAKFNPKIFIKTDFIGKISTN
jgi:translation initiation factor 2 alpha subunit (eIF-2alpha)